MLFELFYFFIFLNIGTVCHVGKSEDRENLLKLAKDTYGGLDILGNSHFIRGV